jgi:cytochrome o ubiquinol oxidase subunit 3
LLASSFACGMAGIATAAKNMFWFQLAMAVTAVLGTCFIALELYEFTHLIGEGNGPGRSAFLSAFFALVGCHGVHVTLGLIWLTTMMAQVWAKGFRDEIVRRIACFSLFWHALDIIWVAVFTVVYLLGKAA